MNKRKSFHTARGIVLPAVLWIFLLISLMYTGYSYSVRTETAITQQLLHTAKTRAAADAAISLTVRRLLASRIDADAPSVPALFEDFFDGIKLKIAVVNESGRIDLNKAPVEMLEILLQDFIPAEEHRKVIVDSLLDWRDSDSEPRELGAEDDEYAALGMPYGAADAPLKSIDEFSLINGVTPELFASLQGLVTVHSGVSKFNPGLAPPGLLAVLSGQSETDAGILSDWQMLKLEDIAAFVGNIPASLISKRQGNVYTIEVEASMDNGSRTRLSSVIKLVAEGNKPYTVLSWKEVEKLGLIN